MSGGMSKKDWKHYIEKCKQPSPRKTEWYLDFRGHLSKKTKSQTIPGKHRTFEEARAAWLKANGRKRLPAKSYLNHYGWVSMK